jgi:hypothetical protein
VQFPQFRITITITMMIIRRRRIRIYCCPNCQIGLCYEYCFKKFHTRMNL